MKIVKPRRGNRATKRIDIEEIRALLQDRRVWCALGVVTAPDDGSEHYEIVTDDGAITDILVEVVLVPSNVEVTARLAGGGNGAGVWAIPDVGDEVLVHVADGRVDFTPTIVGTLPRRGAALEAGDQGPAPLRVVIAAQEVLVHDGAGGAERLVKLSEHQALADAHEAHTHLYIPGPGTGTVASAPPTEPTPVAEGTEVLRAK